MNFSYKVNKIWLSFTALKIIYMFLALFFYANYTKLGDTDRYIGGRTYGSEQWWHSSTHMMDFLAHSFYLILGPVIANLPFTLLSLCGIYYAVKRLKLKNKELFYLLALLSLPSFGIWTSVASKEAVAVFFLGIILGFIIDVIKKNSKKNYLLVLFAFYLCFVFKPQYLIGIFALLTFIFISRTFSLKGIGNLILLGLFFIVSFLMLYIFKEQINKLSFLMPEHFRLSAASTRENTIWLNDFDVFWNAPYGMFIAFIGPTLSEALAKPTHLLALTESMLIVVVFLYGILKLLFTAISIGRLNIFYMSMFITAAIWILFVHYPFGALNPGAAIRYRGNFYAFLVILFYFGYIEVNRRYHHGRLQCISV